MAQGEIERELIIRQIKQAVIEDIQDDYYLWIIKRRLVLTVIGGGLVFLFAIYEVGYKAGTAAVHDALKIEKITDAKDEIFKMHEDAKAKMLGLKAVTFRNGDVIVDGTIRADRFVTANSKVSISEIAEPNGIMGEIKIDKIGGGFTAMTLNGTEKGGVISLFDNGNNHWNLDANKKVDNRMR